MSLLSAYPFFISVLSVSGGWLNLLLEDNGPQGPVVQTKSGFIRGFTMETETFKTFYGFEGIPFAKPPTGQLRFKPPEPVDPWNVTLNANDEGNLCIQRLTELVGNEDCLYLNVYTPKLPEKEDSKYLPVFVVIHGGSFYESSSKILLMGPNTFLENNIVVVKFNYRLGALGFLSTGDEASPGNYGLLDQLMALKWVRENIRSFGGNPDSVTLMGQSAGAMSVSAHLVSPLSKGYFHRAVMHSGMITAPRIINDNPLNVTTALAVQMGCPTSSTQDIVNCLRETDAKTLVDVGNTLPLPFTLKLFPRFVPVVDGIFLPEHPQKLFERGDFHKVPILTGVNRDEGVVFYLMAFVTEFKRSSEIEYIEDYQFTMINSVSSSIQVAKFLFPILYKEYLKGKDSSCVDTVRDQINEIITDLWFNVPLYRVLKSVSPLVPSYMYTFEFVSRVNMFTAIQLQGRNEKVVTHNEELPYLFSGFLNLIKRSEEKEVSKTMLMLWSNFIKYGVPAPDGSPVDWFPITSDEIDYLEITNKFTMKSGYRKEQIQFILELLSKIENNDFNLTFNFEPESLKLIKLDPVLCPEILH